MKIEIVNHWNFEVLFSHDCEGNTMAQTLRVANYAGACLSGASLPMADLRYVEIRGADLRHADLRGADLRESDMRGANVRGADLRGANLFRANVEGVNLIEADIRGATLPAGVNICCVDLGRWSAFIGPDCTRIGCETHSNTEWLSWSPDDVAHMDDDAREYWKRWGETIKAAIRATMEVGK